MKAIDTRIGMGIKIDGKFCVLVGYEHRTPGNLRAFIQLKYRNVQTGQTVEKRFNPSEEVEVIDLDRRTMEYLYSDSSGATFMDVENYDQVVIPASVLGEALKFLRPNAQTVVLFSEERALFVELPASVVLQVTETPPGIKGATVTNQLKDATCETGLVTRVPAFIEIGEQIKVSTADGSYLSRA